MREVYKAADITEAHIIAGMLQAEGIDAQVGGHYLQGGVGELGATNFATIMVEDSAIDQARQLIAEYEQSGDEPVRLSQKEGINLPSSMYSLLFWVITVITLLLLWL